MADRRQQTEIELQAALARSEALNQLSVGIASGTDRADIMRQVVEATARLLCVPYAALWTVDPEAMRLEPAAEFVEKALGTFPPQLPISVDRSLAGIIIREGCPIAVPDVRHHTRWENTAWPGLGHLGAWIGVPLSKDGAPVGILVAMDRVGRAFTEDEVAVLCSLGIHAALAIEKDALASQAAIAIENARLYKATAELGRRRAALLETGAALNAAIAHEGTLQLIIDKAVESLGAEKGALFAYDGAAQELHTVAAHGFTPQGMNLRLRLGESAAGRAILWRRPVMIPDVEADTEHDLKNKMDHLRREGVRALLILPLLTGDEVVGAISLARSQPTRFADEDIALLTLFAHQAAVALRNARLFEELAGSHAQVARQQEQLQELYRLGVTMQAALPLHERLDLILQGVHGVLGLDRIAIFLPDPREEMLECRASFGHLPESAEQINVPLGPEGGALAQAFLEGTEVQWTGEQAVPAVKTLHSRCFVILPLISRDRVIGLLAADNKVSRRPLSEEIVSLLRIFAAQAAIAIENARVYEDSQRRAREATALAEVGRTLSASLDMDRVLELIVQEVQRVMDAPFVGILTLDEASQELAYVKAAGLSAERMTGIRMKVGEGIAGRAVEQGVPMQSPRMLQDPRFLTKGAAEVEGFRSLLCAPLLAGGRPLGVIALFRKDEHEFAPAEVQLLASFADQAAISIHNAHLYEQQQSATRSAQRLRARAEALAAVGQAISASLDLDEVLALVVERATEAIRADAAAVLEQDPATGDIRFRKAHGLSQRVERHVLRADRGIAGAALAAGEPQWTQDLQNDPRFTHPGDVLPLVAEEGIRGALSVTIRGPKEPYGVLSFYRRSPHAFDEEEIAFAVRIADQAAIAIENARLYEQVASHAHTLEERVRERTAELEAASRAKSDFLANMSHELRTPLNAIIGFADLLGMPDFDPLTPKQARYLGNIRTAGGHLLRLVNDILDLTRVEAGRLVLRPEWVEVPGLIAETAEGLRQQAETKGLTLDCDLAPGLPPVRADRVRLRQVLVNLVSNAIKFTPGGGRVTVRAARTESDEGPWLQISVEDTGLGIAPEDMPRLFRRFEQLDTGIAKAYQGAGLGLALSRHLVELQGGTIVVRSAGSGQGTSFTVRLPAEREAPSPLVLIVDDDPMMRDMLAESVRAWGWEGMTAANVYEAHLAVAKARPDLVILDLNLPDGSGTEFASQLRRVLAPSARILVYTGLGVEEGQKALAAGADAYLLKPAMLDGIYAKAQSLLAVSGWSAIPTPGEDPVPTPAAAGLSEA